MKTKNPKNLFHEKGQQDRWNIEEKIRTAAAGQLHNSAFDVFYKRYLKKRGDNTDKYMCDRRPHD